MRALGAATNPTDAAIASLSEWYYARAVPASDTRVLLLLLLLLRLQEKNKEKNAESRGRNVVVAYYVETIIIRYVHSGRPRYRRNSTNSGDERARTRRRRRRRLVPASVRDHRASAAKTRIARPKYRPWSSARLIFQRPQVHRVRLKINGARHS